MNGKDYITIFRVVKAMATLSKARFWAIWAIFVLFAVGYVIGQIAAFFK